MSLLLLFIVLLTFNLLLYNECINNIVIFYGNIHLKNNYILIILQKLLGIIITIYLSYLLFKNGLIFSANNIFLRQSKKKWYLNNLIYLIIMICIQKIIYSFIACLFGGFDTKTFMYDLCVHLVISVLISFTVFFKKKYIYYASICLIIGIIFLYFI